MNLKELIKYCIENFSSDEAATRINQYIEDSLRLKEQEIELKELFKQQNP